MSIDSVPDLYAGHLAVLQSRLEDALARSTLDGLLIAAGSEHTAFLDDRAYPFIVNPHFNHWVPLRNVPESFILVRPEKQPVLFFHQPRDYWYMPAQVPTGEWTNHWEIRVIRDASEVRHQIEPATLGFVGEDTTLATTWGCGEVNPQVILDYLHFYRAYKTDYEVEQLQLAASAAVRGHLQAEETFLAGGSEFEIQHAYLRATGHREQETPYTSIVAINNHASVLHYQHYDQDAPGDCFSMLIDAGANANGYAADITRTYAKRKGVFADLVSAMDTQQQSLIDTIPQFRGYTDLHLAMHRRLADLMVDVGLSTMSAESLVESGVTFCFLPHGLGHLVGLQTHDVGGLQQDVDGTLKQPPEQYPALRLTRTIEDNMVFTIEPGLYFIPILLDQLRATEHGKTINWTLVNELVSFGGIRIEDNILIRDGKPHNLTRTAFAEAS